MTRDIVSGGQHIHAPDDLTRLLRDIHEQAMTINTGKVADYIPALAAVDPEQCALTVATLDGETFTFGDTQTQFSIQSISKIFGLILAMERLGDELWERVKMEPSGQAFNSIVQLEWEKGIPRNPMINAGAILVSDVLVSHYSASKNAVLSFVRSLCGNEEVYADHEVHESEKDHGHRNAALAHLMKSFGNIDSDVDELLDHYFWQCALSMSCENLARSFTFLANDGVCPFSKKEIMSKRDSQRINALLSTSGMYDQSGEFAFTVGVPAKSGVGGGIVAIVPDFGVISAWSPRLNEFGNSARGMFMVREVANKLGLSVY
ncbi:MULTISPECIES: glutaminase A [Idiomarina]|uniref:Glutaminase n=1 Tax=Idiomarina zobellii TaxID=86103 RepID=A0A837NG85_9GAMM|nr:MULTISPECIES: glutaminase A [Idiomarina]KPD24266.1 glutaminase [Idiomarina zobellii]MBF39666.1 glutaminase A [Idiomarinaceae bacterium]SDF65083.1 L-glutaminase [Idiomarina zobellii]